LNYKVLYRKYRPADFDNIVDQSYTIDILKNSISSNKISHAYIFAGPRGTGKTTTAKVFAKSINCENFCESGPCGHCYNCENFGNNPDIIEIDAASNNGVDEIRELINSVKLAPSNSRYKVYIIDEVHMLSQSAFNALLLTLEEPPKHVVFILATTNIESVPVTILSRCQRFDFKKITDKEIINRLKFVCNSENIKISDDALEEIAYLSDGGMRDALSILDQLSSTNENIVLDDVINHFGSISITKITEIIEALELSDNTKIINIIDEFRKSSVEYKNLIKKLLDVLYKRAIAAKEDPEYCGLEYKDIKNLSFDLVDCINKINVAIDPFVLIEMTILNYTNSKSNANMIKINKKINESLVTEEKIEVADDDNSKEEIVSTVEKNNTSEEFKKIRINNCFVNAKKEYLQELKDDWKNYIEILKEDRNLMSLIIDTIPVAASDNYMIITTSLYDTAELINCKTAELESMFNKKFVKNYKLIALSENEWLEEKKVYINNIKNGNKYVFIDEFEENIKKDSNNLEELAKDIFNQDKIEIN